MFGQQGGGGGGGWGNSPWLQGLAQRLAQRRQGMQQGGPGMQPGGPAWGSGGGSPWGGGMPMRQQVAPPQQGGPMQQQQPMAAPMQRLPPGWMQGLNQQNQGAAAGRQANIQQAQPQGGTIAAPGGMRGALIDDDQDDPRRF